MARRAIQRDEDVPGQMLMFPPIAGDVLEFGGRMEIPRAVDEKLKQRAAKVGQRLRRGAVVGEGKLRAVLPHLEAIATLFDSRS